MARLKRIVIVALVFLFLPSQVLANEQYPKIYVQPFEVIGLSQDTEKIFRKILKSSLSEHYKVLNEEGESDVLAMGSLSRLGSKIIVVFQVRSSGNNLGFSEAPFNETVNVYKEEELDLVAKRLVEALVDRKRFGKTAAVGNIVENEGEVKNLKKRLSGSSFFLGSFEPIVGDNYGSGDTGVQIGLGFISETQAYFYESSIAYRLAQDLSYREIPLDFGIGKYFSNSGGSLFISGGLGLRYIRERVEVKKVIDGVVVRTVNESFKDSDLGTGAYAQLGYVFLREHDHRLSLALRYDLSSADPFDRDLAQGLSLNLGINRF